MAAAAICCMNSGNRSSEVTMQSWSVPGAGSFIPGSGSLLWSQSASPFGNVLERECPRCASYCPD